MSEANVAQQQLLLTIIFVLLVFTGILALSTWYRYQKTVQEAIRRSQEVGADEAFLQAAKRRKSIFLRLSDRYDQSESADKIRVELAKANFKIKPSEYMAARILLAILLFYINLIFIQINNFFAAAVAVLIAVYIPPLYLRSQRKRYLNAFNEQLVEATATMASAIRAGLSVPQAIEQVARKMPAPAGQEFRQLSREVNLLGVSVEAGLSNTLQRLPSEDMAVVVSTLVIQRQAGGNLVKALTQLSDIMRERLQLHNEINTMTSEVRYSAYIVMVLPVVMVILLRNISPALTGPLFTHPVGWAAIAFFLAMQILAFILIRQIANIRV